MKMDGFFVVVAFMATAVFADQSLHQKNQLLDSSKEKAEMLMSKLDRHCEVVSNKRSLRHKRNALAGLRRTLIRALQDCDNDGGSYVNPTSAPISGSSRDPCTSPSTVNLTGSWRKDNQGSNIKPADDLYACDRDLQGGATWFRFTGAAGVQLRDTCSPEYSCGAHGGFWSDAPMPTAIGEVKQLPIKGSWSRNCDWYTWPTANAMTVQRCSDRPGDFVYKVRGTSSCYWAFCGMDLVM